MTTHLTRILLVFLAFVLLIACENPTEEAETAKTYQGDWVKMESGEFDYAMRIDSDGKGKKIGINYCTGYLDTYGPMGSGTQYTFHPENKWESFNWSGSNEGSYKQFGGDTLVISETSKTQSDTLLRWDGNSLGTDFCADSFKVNIYSFVGVNQNSDPFIYKNHTVGRNQSPIFFEVISTEEGNKLDIRAEGVFGLHLRRSLRIEIPNFQGPGGYTLNSTNGVFLIGDGSEQVIGQSLTDAPGESEMIVYVTQFDLTQGFLELEISGRLGDEIWESGYLTVGERE